LKSEEAAARAGRIYF